MGRPLNKKFFGNTAGDGLQLAISFWKTSASAVVTGYVVEQVARGQYLAKHGDDIERVALQADAPLATGQARIAVTVFGGGTEYASNIQSKRVKTFEGGNYSWSTDAATAVGQADLPLA